MMYIYIYVYTSIYTSILLDHSSTYLMIAFRSWLIPYCERQIFANIGSFLIAFNGYSWIFTNKPAKNSAGHEGFPD